MQKVRRALRPRRSLGLLALALVGQQAVAQSSFTHGSTTWPEIPAPPKAKVEWVSDDMRVNGIPMRVQRFDSAVSKEEIVAYYVAHWKTSQVPAKPGQTVAAVTPHGPDTLVARTTGPFYSLVKVRSAGSGSEGTISTSQVLGVEPSLNTSGVPAPSSAKAVNVVEAIDNGKRNKQVLFVSDDSIDSVANYYAHSLKNAGWTLVQEQKAPATAKSSPAIVRMFSRKDQQLDIAVGVDTERRVTLINANLVSF